MSIYESLSLVVMGLTFALSLISLVIYIRKDNSKRKK